MAGDYDIPRIYQGNQSFNPSEKVPHFLGKANLVKAKEMGMTTDPRTAAQLSDLSNKLNMGVGVVEVGALGMNEWDTIPKEHFEEMRRKAELAGAEVTLHAPIQGMDPAGFGERGWSKTQQEIVERQLKQVVDKASRINKKGNMPITIHGSNYHGSTWKYIDNPKTGKREKVFDSLMVVDVKTGEAMPVKEEVKYYPEKTKDGKIKKEIHDINTQFKSINSTKWDDDFVKIQMQRENADRIMKNIDPLIHEARLKGELPNIPDAYEKARQIDYADEYIREAERSARATFSKAYEIAENFGDENQIKALNEVSENYRKILQIDEKKGRTNMMSYDPKVRSEALNVLVQGLRDLDHKDLLPNQFMKVEEFATKKASETFANVALHSYKEYGNGAPIVSVENLDQGRFGFSQGEDLARLIDESRKKFEEKAIKEGYSKKEAKKAAKKMIGVTFDIGHANISRKYGYNEDELAKEAAAVSKYLKHVHLTDNFGNADTHLPIGMGNVPVEKMLKALGKPAEDAKKINEVGGWYQYFKTNPYPELLQATGSPIYSSTNGPYWSETTGFQESYHSGYGQMLPQTHYESFGAGFSRLPAELGGSTTPVGGGAGRMGGGF